MRRIYCDYAATTPLGAEALAAMLPILEAGEFNPSSQHAEGRAARAVLDGARERIARALGASAREIVFTASGSEADALAIVGVAEACVDRGRHIVSVATEHHAVLHALDVLVTRGWDVTLLDVDEAGRVDPAAFAQALRSDTVLATIMLANNEIGTVAPVAELAAIARRAGVLVHTDAVQAPYVMALDVGALGVDLLAIAAHKFYGPKGVGALYVRRGTPLAAQLRGGSQEAGRRAGTENLAAIAGMAAALETAQRDALANATRLGRLRDRLEAEICARVSDVRVNGAGAERLPTIASVAFAGVPSDALLMALDLDGIAASAGSACAAGSAEPSHVVAALGLPEQWSRGVVRFSFGQATCDADVEAVVKAVSGHVPAMRPSGAAV